MTTTDERIRRPIYIEKTPDPSPARREDPPRRPICTKCSGLGHTADRCNA